MFHVKHLFSNRTLAKGKVYSGKDRKMAEGKRFRTGPQPRKKMATCWKITIIALSVVLALVIAAISIFFYYFGGLKTTYLTQDNEELGITSETVEMAADKDITNIALLGVDSREHDDTGRSDAIMILSVDKAHGKIKLTSLARDTRVYIYDRSSYDKFAHAYAYGGAPLAIKTMNQNFGLNIKEYITVNFDQLATVINAVGGVTLNVTEAERQDANYHIGVLGLGTPIPRSGTVLLTGEQAVGYARVRSVDNDTFRNQRQRNVLRAIFEKMQGKSTFEYADFIRQLLPVVETSLDYGDLIGLSGIMFGTVTMEEMQFPNENSNAYGGAYPTADDPWYYVYDLTEAGRQLHRFIYEEE